MTTPGQGQIILGNYRVGTSIGQGTFGKVKLGTHILTQQKVAIKTLQKQKIVQQSDIERVTRQICILKILRHPNIIQLYQIIQTKTDIHLIMQYAEGGQLFDYIVKRKRLDQAQAIKFMQQIIAGVQYIHKNGIVHRDLKPQNLLLDHNKNIKIVDFGLSNQYKPGEKLKTACGSPCYAAPQMIAGKKYECLNADIWSCGIILYAMLCGYLPFQDPNTNKLYKKIIAGDFELPKILSGDAKDILRSILNVNPETRYKINQIRQSKWYNLTNYKYESKGIIVGKDQIQPNQQIIRLMEGYNVDPVQARTYIINNRHNHTTALYYLLEIKLGRQGKLQHGSQNNTVGTSAIKPKIIQDNFLKTQTPSSDTKKQINSPKKDQKKRQGSPLIYRPQKKPQYYIPYGKKPKQASKQHSAKNNDSMNVSNIISSLVQANKNKLINKPIQSLTTTAKKDQVMFNKQDFKLFPNKKNSSIYQPSSGSKVSTSRSKYDDKSFDFNRGSLTSSQTARRNAINTGISNTQTSSFGSNSKQQSKGSINVQNGRETSRGQQFTSNKKRQQLSDQLKQISIKIDQQIMELRKQNTTGNNQNTNPMTGSYNLNSSRQSFTGGHQTYISPATTRKKSQGSHFGPNSSLMASKEVYPPSRQSLPNHLNQSVELKDRQSFQSQQQVPSRTIGYNQNEIRTHIGPFNAQCIFMENARSLILKISSYLSKHSIRYTQPQPFNILMGDGQKISIQALHGIAGVHIVKFSSNNTAFNEAVIQVLSK